MSYKRGDRVIITRRGAHEARHGIVTEDLNSGLLRVAVDPDIERPSCALTLDARDLLPEAKP